MKLRYLLLAALLCVPASAHAEVKTGGPTSPDGKATVQTDLPLPLRMKNTGGTDGSGLCVFTSITHAAKWQGEARLFDFRKKMEGERGGGWPEKVDTMIAKHGAGTPYVQYQGNDLAVLKSALDSGLMPSVTWNGKNDPHYRSSIAHMVNLVAATGLGDSDWFVILDNNYIGEADLVWMRPKDFLAGFAGKGGGWAVFLLDRGPPPPVPVNAPGDDLDPWGGAVYEWRYDPCHPRHLFLWATSDKARCVGAHYLEKGYFRFIDWSKSTPSHCVWLQPGPAPFELPIGPGKVWKEGAVGVVQDFGVMRLDYYPPRGKGEERWTLSGKASDRATCLALLTRHKGKRSLTVVLPAAERAKVLADLTTDPLLAPWRDSLIVQGYEPGDVLASGVGLPAGITIQAAPDGAGRGKVLHRQASYTTAAKLASALRKTDPNYSPANDPDLTQPPKLTPLTPGGGNLPTDLTPAMIVVALGSAGIYLLRKAVD